MATALDDNDPDIIAGPRHRRGKSPTGETVAEDPDIVAGRAIAAPKAEPRQPRPGQIPTQSLATLPI